jgi:hypothetical protein
MKLKSYYISNSEYWWQFPVLNPELGTGDSFQYSTQSWVLVTVSSTQPTIHPLSMFCAALGGALKTVTSTQLWVEYWKLSPVPSSGLSTVKGYRYRKVIRPWSPLQWAIFPLSTQTPHILSLTVQSCFPVVPLSFLYNLYNVRVVHFYKSTLQF